MRLWGFLARAAKLKRYRVTQKAFSCPAHVYNQGLLGWRIYSLSKFTIICSLLLLLAGQLAQVYDVDQRSLRYQWKFEHPIEHWVWLTANTLAVVTEVEVFHWTIKCE